MITNGAIIPAFPTYSEYKDSHKDPSYKGKECFVGGCHEPAEYEGGDARFWCGMCEKHSGIRWGYLFYLLAKTGLKTPIK